VPRTRGTARAKDISRAEARRRYRAGRQEDLARAEQEAIEEADQVVAAEPDPPSKPLSARLSIPDVRADLAALPGFFLTKRLLWLTAALLLAGFLAGLALNLGALSIETTTGAIAVYLYQSTLLPPAIIPVFLAGFAVPRGSYLAGILVGFVSGILYLITLLAAPTPVTVSVTDLGALLLISIVSGGVIGGFASWYREFLQRSAAKRRVAQQERQKQRRRDERKTAKSSRYPASPP
jgi:hypothetical protein